MPKIVKQSSITEHHTPGHRRVIDVTRSKGIHDIDVHSFLQNLHYSGHGGIMPSGLGSQHEEITSHHIKQS